MKKLPKFKETDDNKRIEAEIAENIILRNTKSARKPRNRGQESAEGEAIESDGLLLLIIISETTSVVDEGIRRLLLEDGEDTQHRHC